ncbi:hypothetical protein ACVWWK_001564 [Bradyrhizobium sp. LB9.1b]
MPKQYTQKRLTKHKNAKAADKPNVRRKAHTTDLPDPSSRDKLASGDKQGSPQAITWMHISDWHQGAADFDRSVLLQRMLEDTQRRADLDPQLAQIDLVIFSGDVAFRGDKSEYATVKKQLIDPLRSLLGPHTSFIFAPGNHDLERSKIAAIPSEWTKLLASNAPERQKQLGELLYDPKRSPMILWPFKNFYEFSAENGCAYRDGECVSSFSVSRGQRVLGIATINTAVCCARHSLSMPGVGSSENDFWDYGTLAVTEKQIRDAISRLEGAEYKILVMHHPLSWVHEEEQAGLEQLIASNFRSNLIWS